MNSDLHIILIKPNIGRREHSLYVDNASMEPLQLGVLAALTPEDIEVVMYDDRLEPIPYSERADLVAITVETFTARRSYEIADEYRKRGVKVLMGGMHVKLLPEEAKEHADSVMIGDAEDKWREGRVHLRKYMNVRRSVFRKRVSSQGAIYIRARNTCRYRCCSFPGAAGITANTVQAVCILKGGILQGI